MNTPPDTLQDPPADEPMRTVAAWLAQATEQRVQPNPNAMVLATTTRDCQPSARVVLCKAVVPDPGYLVFYTNYRSRKGQELAANPRAAAVIHWDLLQRQIRVEGIVTPAPESDSDAYFASRPWQSRIGAWASAQSQPIASRELLLNAVVEAARRFGVPNPSDEKIAEVGVAIPRPPHWGGYRLWADAVELWVGGDARIHDRFRWTRSLTKISDGQFATGAWTVTRLQP
jgi:pyridoxamine 5'-phosphate oxidase